MKGSAVGPTPYCDCLFTCDVLRQKLSPHFEYWDGYYCGENNFGKYTMLSYDLPVTLAGLNVSLGLSDFSADSNSGLADEDTLVFTFSK